MPRATPAAAVAAPVRLAEYLASLPERRASISEIATGVGMTKSAALYHLNGMAKADAVHKQGSGNRTQWVYGKPAFVFQPAPSAPDTKTTAAPAASHAEEPESERSRGVPQKAVVIPKQVASRPGPKPTGCMVVVIDGSHVQAYPEVAPELLTSVNVMLSHATARRPQ